MWFCFTTINYEKVAVVDVPPFISSSSACIDRNITGVVTIPNVAHGFPVRRIASGAFINISGLTSVIIPSSVKYIAENALYGCYSLESITCENPEPPTGLALKHICSNDYNVTLYVPSGSVSKYKNADGWKNFKEIKGIGVEDDVEPISIVLPNYTENIKVGESITLVPTIAPSNATTTLTWTSSNTSVATVSQSGVVKGISVGESKITVTTSNGKSAYCYVKVAEDVVYVSNISLNSTSITLNAGETKQLTATISPSNATDKSVSWSSSNSSVAQVSSSGLVTAKSAGSATITCKASDGSGTKVTCSVTVKAATVEPTGITLPYSKTVKVGSSFTMTYTLTPSNATTTLTWSSDDTSIATVSSSGLVKGIKAGTTKIRVKTANGKTDYCDVSVESNGDESLKDGDTFTANTDENASIIYKVISSTNKTCEVSRNRNYGYDNQETTTTKVTIPKTVNGYSVVAIGAGAFYYWQALKTVSLPESVVKIDEDAFYYCKELASITLPNNVEEIGESAFSNCGKLASINIPNMVKTIGGHAFWCCESLKSISLPSSLNTIGGGAFYSCNSLTSFTLPKSVSKIENDWLVGENILGVCRNLKEIKVEEGNQFYDSRNSCNAIIETSTNKLVSGCKNTKIPNTVKELGTYSFYYAQMTSIDIPNSVKSIGEHAFCGCSKLKTVKLPGGLTRIENDTFNECALITSLDFLPSSVSFIGNSAFESCGFTTIKIPDGIEEIDKGAFTFNDKVTTIIIPSSVKTIGNDAFGYGTTKNAVSVISYITNPFDIDARTFSNYMQVNNQWTYVFTPATLYVPQGCKAKYQQAEGWKEFSNIVEMSKIVLNASPTSCGMNNGAKVFLSASNTTEAVIFYTLDGTTPTKSSIKYTSSGISINEACTLKAIAYKDGYLPSDVLTETYTINVEDIILAIASFGYATFYSSKSAYTLPNGLSAQVVTGATNGKLTYKTIADGSVSGVVPKETAVMLVSDTEQAGTFTLTSSESTASYTGTNLLRGSEEATTTTGDGLHYKLSYGPSDTKWDDVFGWYWGTQNGAPFQIEGHKAWLVVPKGNGTRAAGFSVEGEVLGIESLDSGTGSPIDECYDLQGRRVSQPARKGIYIRNGKKVVK